MKKSTDLILKDSLSKELLSMVSYDEKHKELISVISENLPAIKESTQFFGKTQSKFMDNCLTVSHPTPLRNVRQILAEIEKTSLALKESHFKRAKEEIKLKMKYRELDNEKDDLAKELIQVEIDEMLTNFATSDVYVSGAIRKIANYVEQYNAILKSLGKDQFDEKDFEDEEERYHIMKAFDQALTAARSHPHGMIDEGNHIYLNQLGINGAIAQKYISELLLGEQQIIKDGKIPSHKIVSNFLQDMAKTFAGCSKEVLETKGMVVSDIPLLQNKIDQRDQIE